MKILIYGAGIIGSIYAARLHEINADITLLARRERYENLEKNGLQLNNILTGKQTKLAVPLTLQLNPNDFYDLIIVTVRLEQLETVLPVLRNNSVCQTIMFMLNNPGNLEEIKNALKPKQIIFGFPGIGGTNQNNIIDFIEIKQQKTTIGTSVINDSAIDNSDIINGIKMLFEKSGFKMAVSENMNAWLKTHAVFMSCIAASIIKESGNSIQLSNNRKSIGIMVKSIEEGFKALIALGIPIEPKNLKTLFMIMPKWFSILYWQKALKGNMGTLAIAPHIISAHEETRLIAQEILKVVNSSPVAAPAFNKLLSGIY